MGEDWFSYVLTIFGTILSVYFANRKQHKFIRYYLAKNKYNNYIVVFWNASKKVITKEDLYELNLVVPYEAICTVFCSDDIKLRMKKQGPSEVLQECINVELEFDYLCPNEGYIISVSNEDEKNDEICFYGRVMEENKYSVYYSENMYNSGIGRVLDKPMEWLSILFSILLVFIGLGLLVINKTIMLYVLTGFLFVSVGLMYLIETVRMNHKPHSLKRKHKKEYRGYKIVRDARKLIKV